MLILSFIFHLVISDQSYAVFLFLVCVYAHMHVHLHVHTHSEYIGQRSPLGILFWYSFFEIGSLIDPLNSHGLYGQRAPGILLCPPPQQQDCISYRMHHHTRTFTRVLWIISGPYICAVCTSETRPPPAHPNCIFDLRCLSSI